MKRIAWVSQLKPDKVDHYVAEHNGIWPELAAEIRQAGVTNYSIFLDEETMMLFGYWEMPDDADPALNLDPEIMQRWADNMRDCFVSDPAPFRYGRQVFHLG